MIRYLEGHKEPVYAVAYSPDGQQLATGGFDKTVRVWDRASGQMIRSLADATAQVLAVAISKDGKQLAAGGLDKIALVYDFAAAIAPPAAGAPALAPRLKLAGHGAAIYALDISPDSSRLVTTSADAGVKLWNLADGANYASAAGAAQQVNSVAFHPAGQEFAAAGQDKVVRRWQTADAKLIQELKDGIADGLYSVAYSPDGSKLVAAGLGRVWQLWNVGESQPAKTVAGHRDYIYRAIFNPAGNRLATLGYTSTLKIWDIESGTPVFEEQLPARGAYNMAYSPDGAELAIALADPRLVLFTVPESAR